MKRARRIDRRRRTADRCAGCRRKIHHAPASQWRALGSKVAIRCLDCRLAYCPRCARQHFLPLYRARARVLNCIVDAAMTTMRKKCAEARA